jgi:excinuclease ABC subunit A
LNFELKLSVVETKQNNSIIVTGAREHNLKDITVEIPKNKLVVLSGVSGSGKSSLAMDTLYAEGQRRYVESLSSYARQFLGVMKRPDIDTIEGLSPAIAIDQHGLSHNPRSTVGTATEIYDYFRVLFARIGHPHCPDCGREISQQTSLSITSQIIELINNKINQNKTGRFIILAPIIRDKRGEFDQLFKNFIKKGFDEVRVDGQTKDLNSDFGLIKTNRHNIDVIVDKLDLTAKTWDPKNYKQRILDDIEIALENSNGLVILAEVNDPGFDFPQNPKNIVDHLYSQRFACPICNISLPEIEPRIFSFNSPQGACPECDGIGSKLKIDTSKVSKWRAQMMESQYYSTTSDSVRESIEKFMIKEPCPKCKGSKLNKEALSITIDNSSIAEISALPLNKLYEWTKKISKSLESEKEKEISKPLLKEINSRLNFLLAVGVDYLTLDRSASTLSVGEAQRIRLSSQIGTGLTGVLYILDEPTVGLHQRDTQKLIHTLNKLRDLGNTVVVVEHDKELLKNADWIIDFGPGAGKNGGKVIAFGTPKDLINNPNSVTGKYLKGDKVVPLTTNINNQSDKVITLSGCKEHNLKNITVKIPTNKLTCITGVSGSGKSTLIHDTLYPALKKAKDPYYREKPGKFDKLEGSEYFDQILMVDQTPVGRTSRSNPATYIGVWTNIRELFAKTREAQLKGYNAGHFSFNVEGGRCEACKGQGQIKVEMQFLADIWVACEECRGTRFKQEVLEVEYKGKSIADVLELTIDEAIGFFSSFNKITKKLKLMKKIGLDYLDLGQPSPTLSGGESQRLKLARELTKSNRNTTIYLLDEPTTGLHFADIEKLLKVIRKLIEKGNTVVVIEHNLDVIKNADYVIDLGPEGGEAGGNIVATGSPKEISKNNKSWTGNFLQSYFNKL